MPPPEATDCGKGGRRDRYAVRLLRAQERDRKWLADRIHEDPLQMLSHITRLLDRATNASLTAADLNDVAREAARLTATVSDHLQALARDLRPSVLDDFGLAPALRALAADLTLRSGVAVRFTVHGDQGRADSDIEATCYRIAQEALQNVERHAEAGQVDVRLTVSVTTVRMVVADDGVGFSPRGRHDVGAGFGLEDMEQRALALGGSVRVRSLRPSGTVLRLSLPRKITVGAIPLYGE